MKMKKTTIGKTGFSQTRTPTASDQKGFVPSLATPETQIAKLNRSIRRDLDRLAGMVRAGKYDLAAERSTHVAKNVQTIRNLARLYGDRMAEPVPVETEKERNARLIRQEIASSKRPSIGVKVKPRRFKTFSEK